MQSKSLCNFQSTRQKAKKIVHTIWDGPGKFFIVIFISMFIVGIHESIKSINCHEKSSFKPSFSATANMKFPTNNKENKIGMVEIIKKNQNLAQNQQEEEDLSILLEMANYQMEHERKKSFQQSNFNDTHIENENDDEIIVNRIIREEKIYINI